MCGEVVKLIGHVIASRREKDDARWPPIAHYAWHVSRKRRTLVYIYIPMPVGKRKMMRPWPPIAHYAAEENPSI